MLQEAAYFSALIAGIISFISPCVLPLVPPYMCYMAGSSISQLNENISEDSRLRVKIFANSILFVVGFSTVFIALGAGASSISQYLRAHMDLLSIVAGVIIIIMGLHFIGLFKIGFLYREARFQSNSTGYIGSYVMGLAFAFGWTPCIGPVLGVILGIAATLDTVGEGAILLAVYSAGLGIPFILAALFVKPFLSWLAKFRKNLGMIEKVMGVLLVATGLLFITGGMQTIAWWMLELFPGLANVG
ncbi:MAG: cytochrome c biogenesis protein CcdA [Hyphomicrobiales bacterium]|nr:cytochrome c biogenesis protein CcdA [Hyphomicrobiales bacterium]